MNEMIAYCGLDCAACDAYRATVTGDSALREKTARLWSELNGVEITPEQITCEGCRAGGKKSAYCERLCAIRQCAQSKAMATCGGCALADGCGTVGALWANNAEARLRAQAGKSV